MTAVTAAFGIDLSVGAELPELRLSITRESLVKYAGASGDFNIIHWSDRAAEAAGLPGVISHGMLTMAAAIRVVTSWTRDPERVIGYRTRFSRPLVVPNDDTGVEVRVTGTVVAVDGDRAEIAIHAYEGEAELLSGAIALVDLSERAHPAG